MRNLVSQGFDPMQLNNLDHWCEVVEVYWITRVSLVHRQMGRNLPDSLLFQRQFRSFVQNFCKRCFVRA